MAGEIESPHPSESLGVERGQYVIYRHDASGALVDQRADLLDHPRLVAQLGALERRTARGGRDSIDSPPTAHEDVANAACGALVLVGVTTTQPLALSDDFGTTQEDIDAEMTRRNRAFADAIRAKGSWNLD